jgi:hypothetical protein
MLSQGRQVAVCIQMKHKGVDVQKEHTCGRLVQPGLTYSVAHEWRDDKPRGAPAMQAVSFRLTVHHDVWSGF